MNFLAHEQTKIEENYKVSGHEFIRDKNLELYLSSKRKWDKLIKEASQNLSNKVRSSPESERSELIKDALQSSDINIQKEAAYMINFAPESERGGLRDLLVLMIREGLNNPDIWVQKEVLRMINLAPESERGGLIKKALQSPDINIQREVVRMIDLAPESEREGLRDLVTPIIREGLNNPDIWVQKETLQMLNFASESARAGLENMVAQIIQKGFESPDIAVQKKVVRMINFAPESERAELIKKALQSPDIAVQEAGVLKIRQFSKITQLELLVEAQEKIGDSIVSPPLYNQASDVFFRKNFPKTGSSTTLLGGSLKNKLIIRHIEPATFLAWQSVYEDYQMWKKNGFNYVPVEPIVSYRFNKKTKLVEVFTGVLDISLAKWSEITSLYENELDEQKKKIMSVYQRKISHGHDYHNHNFILRFYRDDNGHADLSKIPRLYVIDFDKAQLN